MIHGYDVAYKSQKKKTSVPILNIDSKKKQEIDKALIECVILDSRPFGDFSKPGMKKFLNVLHPGYKPPTRKTITSKLSIFYNKYKRQLIDIFKKIQHIALTTDVWKAKNNFYYVCLTAHFMDSQMKYESMIISFRKFFGRHYSSRIKKWISN